MAYAKIVPSMFTGSMRGAGAVVFATWTYALANARLDLGSTVELFPRTVAEALGENEVSVIIAIEALCSPDQMSRTSAHEGRRLVRTTELKERLDFQPTPHANLYYIPSYETFSMAPSTSSLYWRLQKRKQRHKKELSNTQLTLKPCTTTSNNGHSDDNNNLHVQPCTKGSAQETDADAEYPKGSLSSASLLQGHLSEPPTTPPKNLEPAVRISYEKEIARAELRLRDLKAAYSKPYPKPILSEIKSIRTRTAFLKRQLGACF